MANGYLDLRGTPMLVATGTNKMTVGTNGAASLQLMTNAIVRQTITSTGQTTFSFGSYASNLRLYTAEVDFTLVGGGGTETLTNLIPAGAIVLGVAMRVTTIIVMGGGGATWSIGDGTTADRWGAGILLPAGTTTSSADFKAATTLLQCYKTATSVVLTANAGTFTSGAVRATVYYFKCEAPGA